MPKIDEKLAVEEILISEQQEDEIGAVFDRLYARRADLTNIIANAVSDLILDWREWTMVEISQRLYALEDNYRERKLVEELIEKYHDRYPSWKPF